MDHGEDQQGRAVTSAATFAPQWLERTNADSSDDVANAWEALDEHFGHHAALVERFRSAGPRAVIGMWASGANEFGESLSPFERSALRERHCELFGRWPDAEPSL
jgi:hypothetical protein